jgi:hypothetical protein
VVGFKPHQQPFKKAIKNKSLSAIKEKQVWPGILVGLDLKQL